MTIGMKVSLPGKDVYSTNPRDYGLHSEYATVKIYKQAQDQVTINASSSSTITIAHNLGFVPMCMIFVELATGHWYCGVSVPSQADGFPSSYKHVDPNSANTYADATNLVFTITNTVTSSQTVKYHYYIFADDGI